jgi:L-2-hydroxyglutarate oxidase LhgO
MLGTEMMNLNTHKKKKKNAMLTAATVLIAATLAASTLLQQLQQAEGYAVRCADEAPMAVSGENVYVV